MTVHEGNLEPNRPERPDRREARQESDAWTDASCVRFLRWALPRLAMRWKGFRKVRRQVCRRIRGRARELELQGFAAYRRHLTGTPEEWAVLDGLCRITISRFFRDRRVFETLGSSVLPARADRAGPGGEVRAWSAGCGSGEEPYTLSILWREQVLPLHPATGFRVIATDAGSAVLERARAARYPSGTLKELPDGWLERAFDPKPGPSGGMEHVLRSVFRQQVELLQQDLREEMPPGPFDVVCCRNLVFTYFEQGLQRSILDRVLERLLPGGTLVLGAHEELPPGRWPLSPHPDSRCIQVHPDSAAHRLTSP